MKEEKKQFEKPIILKEEKYQTAHIEHCHEVKECDPYPMRT